ncbi:hypothetical protein SK128_011522 [Halocaridina rubra]|uniref:Uncharacterized protein n=1 Tax=Halocaridina rubra TaxID=373956 RepID=A0AAN8WMN1_HALRR
MSISVSAIVLGNHTTTQDCNICGKTSCYGPLALTVSHHLHTVLASCALLDSSEGGLCCAECIGILDLKISIILQNAGMWKEFFFSMDGKMRMPEQLCGKKSLLKVPI